MARQKKKCFMVVCTTFLILTMIQAVISMGTQEAVESIPDKIKPMIESIKPEIKPKKRLNIKRKHYAYSSQSRVYSSVLDGFWRGL